MGDIHPDRPDPEPVDTTAELSAVLRLFRTHADRALDPDDELRQDNTLENIRDTCDSMLEDD